MDFSWIFYAVVLFVAGSSCVFMALSTLDRLDRPHTSPSAPPPPLAARTTQEPAPKLTRLGRPVQQIQLL
jgi:hypothetical protein